MIELTSSTFTVPAVLCQGRYSIGRLLGTGVLAQVYECYDHDLGLWRAVKFFAPDRAEPQFFRESFEQTVDAVLGLEHPNVVQIHDRGIEEGSPFIVMELATGGSLQRYLKTHGAMDPGLALEVVIQACAGVSAAHQHGVVHYDLRPSNVLVDRNGVCKVTDFGLARLAPVDPRTQPFRSPEQRNSHDVSLRTDVYALGAMLYALITGSAPPELFMASHQRQLLLPLPDQLWGPMLKAVDYEPVRRYPSVEALRVGLVSVQALLPPPAADVPDIICPALQSSPIPKRAELGEVSRMNRASVTGPTIGRGSRPTQVHPATPRPTPVGNLQRVRATIEPVLPSAPPQITGTPRPSTPLHASPRRDEVLQEAVVEGVRGAAQEAFDFVMRMLPLWLRLMVIPSLVAAGIFVCLLLIGAVRVGSAHTRAVEAEAALWATVDSQRNLADDLRMIRSRSDVPALHLNRIAEAEGDARLQALDDYLHSMDQVDRFAPGAQLANRDAIGTHRKEALQSASREYRSSQLAWEQEANGTVGRLACAFRLATCP